MTNDPIIDVTTTGGLTHPEAMALQAAELERTLELLRTFDDADWTAPTDCPAWDVHHMYLHVLGTCEAAASMRENAHQMRLARRHRKAEGGPLEAGLSNVQVRERTDLRPDEMVEALARIAPVAVRKRTTLPSLVRRISIGIDGPVVERWSLGYLTDTIYLRDLWMHRIDACRATGRDPVLSADHDGRIVADVVAEWARRHGQPFTLTLTGPAGGRYRSTGSRPTAGAPTPVDAGPSDVDPSGADSAGDGLELDAVEFCRTLAGRAPAAGLLTTIVPF